MAETNDDRLDDVLSTIEKLGPAIKARASVEQAKALLMAEHGWDDQQAFDRLVEISQDEHMKLVHVAQQIRARVFTVGDPSVPITEPDSRRDEGADR